ncbi:GspH/FimT family pseudopilin [Deinococcus sp. LM3]|uniref:pilus assembly FimT family protein n=1 Tax=Deinococcus sp. LM3 TaxID=1938608 RepID=UPI0009CF313F|nr:GspH/FimT family pseudopilin [Deinococcus sp. LM3]OOV13775.1 type II secretion system protein GspH [Deinococcus sp. LM3]
MRRLHARQAAFTLLELLIAMAILAIVAGIFSFSLIGTLRASQVREAAAQLSADLRQARSDALRTGQSTSVTVAANSSVYTFTRAGVPQTRTLPAGVTLTGVTGVTSVVYTAPTGTTGGNGATWTLTSPGGTRSLKVKVIGITGKVMTDATN